jgi:phosphate transport system protein
MSKHLERDLQSLEQELLALSAMVEDMIEKASLALREQRDELAKQVINSDDYVDQREVHIEEECLKILALHQPVAIDLRRTATVLKVNNDLERIADLAVNVAERAVQLVAFPDFTVPPSLDTLAEKAVAMVHDSLDAFVNLDVDAAQHIRRIDDEIDMINVEVILHLRSLMQDDPSVIEPALHCFSASRHLERIADHATNIAEDVIYLVQGEIARHKYDEAPASGDSHMPAGLG